MPDGATFVSEALRPSAHAFTAASSPAAGGLSHGEPPLPAEFGWHDERLVVREVVRRWRSTVTDRGDTYLAKHWYELAPEEGRPAVVYFDRTTRRNEPRWWLFTLATEVAR